MILLGRPTIPPGARPFVAMSASEPPSYTIRYAFAGEDETTDRPRVARSPTFTRLVVADQYRAWVADEVAGFSYPEGDV